MQPENPGQPPGFGPQGGFGAQPPHAPGQPAPQPGGFASQPGPYGQPAPQPGGFGAAQPGAYGQPAPQPGGFGSPAHPAGGYPPQPGAFGSPPGGFVGQPNAAPPSGFGAPQAGFPSQPGAFGPPQPMPPPARSLGLFESVPCPHCGSAMRSSAGYGGSAGRVFGGLVGWLLITAIASKYYCPQHGEVPTDALPSEHRSTVMIRRVLMGGGAVSLLFLVLGCVVFSALLREY